MRRLASAGADVLVWVIALLVIVLLAPVAIAAAGIPGEAGGRTAPGPTPAYQSCDAYHGGFYCEVTPPHR